MTFPAVDVSHRIAASSRSIGTRTLDAGQARVLAITRRYQGPVEDVWEACTDPERLARWFLPISGDLRLGGSYQIEGNAHGTIERCDPPRSFAATWEFGGDVSWIDVSLAPDGDGTRFTLEHVAHVDDERWAQFGPGAVGVGWDSMMLGLTMHLESGASIDPAEAVAWTSSPDGVRFMTESSDAWRAASVAAGEDPDAAAAAAARTTAAYTGVEHP
jgi:uncharacterized protein YndB with AHSA1/START domain